MEIGWEPHGIHQLDSAGQAMTVLLASAGWRAPSGTAGYSYMANPRYVKYMLSMWPNLGHSIFYLRKFSQLSFLVQMDEIHAAATLLGKIQLWRE